ncbi:hypothetical protein [Streptomyces eurythermus]
MAWSEEGVIREHVLQDGVRRDSVAHVILDRERQAATEPGASWPLVVVAA